MKVKVEYQDGEKFVSLVRKHKIIIDQPESKGGTDTGMNPLEIFLSSLGACVAVYAKRYCCSANIDTKGLSVEVESDLNQDAPLRLTPIKVKINLSQDLGPRKSALLNFVKNCPIHNTLKYNSEIEFL